MDVFVLVATVLTLVYLTLFLVNDKVRFHTKLFVHYTNILLASLLPIPLALLRPNDVRNTNYCSFILRHLSKVFGITWRFKGLEHVTGEDACVLVCNHQSSLDVILMMELWPLTRRCAPVIKKELMYAGPFGLNAILSGSFFVDRSNPAKAKATLKNALWYLTDKKIKLWVFPEGTRNDRGDFLPFKKGAFHMAIQAQVPLVPMVVSSYSSFYNKRTHKFDNGGNVEVVILPPVPTAGKTVDDIDDLIATIRKSMLDTYYSISNITPKPDVNGTPKKLNANGKHDKADTMTNGESEKVGTMTKTPDANEKPEKTIDASINASG